MTSKTLQKHWRTSPLYLKFLLITWSRDRKENSQCTNVTNLRSYVGPLTPFYTEQTPREYIKKLLRFCPSLSQVFDKWIPRTSCPRTRLAASCSGSTSMCFAVLRNIFQRFLNRKFERLLRLGHTYFPLVVFLMSDSKF